MPTRQDLVRLAAQAEEDVRAGRLSRRDFLYVMGMFGGAAFLAACGAPAATTPTAAPTTASAPVSAPRGRLRVAFDAPANLDPALVSSDTEVSIIGAIYDYLIDITSENTLAPRLATAWESTPDGLTYTITLAEKVTFHDGSPFSADDVVWTYNRLRDPANGFATADLYANITEVKADGPTKVIFTLAQPNPFFLFDLSDNHAVITKANSSDLSVTFNGTGPFKVKEYKTENYMSLEANPNYFIAGKPGAAILDFAFFPDASASVDALKGNQVDLFMRMPTALFQGLTGEAGITTVSIPTNGFDTARIRTDREPGNNPKVVEAFRLATDRQAIYNTINLNLGAQGRDTPIGPLYKAYYTEEFALPARDPAKAKALLAEAGYPDGLKMDLYVPDSGDRPDMAAVLKAQWIEAGIDVNIVLQPENAYYADDGWLAVDLGITPWGSRPTPQFYFDVMLATGAKWNEAHFSDPELDELIKKAGGTLDEAERVTAYKEIQRILIERGPLFLPYFFAQLGAIREGFTGFTLKAFAGRTDLAAIVPPAA